MNNVIEVGFDYSQVEEICRDDVRDAAVRIKVRMARTAEDIIEIGRDLIAVKKALGHGHFLRWIEAEFNWGPTTASKFMNVADRLGANFQSSANLSFEALATLAAPSTPDTVVDEVVERAAEGEAFTAADIKAMRDEFSSEKRELKRQIDDAKLKARDAKATQIDFDQQLQEARTEASILRDEMDTLRQELEAARRGMVGSTKIVSPIDDREAVERHYAALVSAWNKAGDVARQRFRDEILDAPVFDRSAA